jgi:type I restriction enzyme S subunit
MTYIKDSSRLKYVTEDDILIGRYGSASGDKQKDSLGRVCRGLSGAYNVALMKLEPKSIGSEFAYQVVSSSSFYDYLQGASSKAVQAGFSKSEIANLQIVLPPRKILDHYELLGIIFWAETKLISEYQNIRITLAKYATPFYPNSYPAKSAYRKLNTSLKIWKADHATR